MTALVLNPGWTDEFVSEPATGAHAAEVFGLICAELISAFGFCPDTAEDVRAWLEPPETARSAQLLIRDKDMGALVQWWAALQDPGAELFHAMIRTEPGFSEPTGDRLAEAGWATLLDWIRRESAPEQVETVVHSGVANGDEAAARRLRAAGFTYGRTFWEMSASVADAPHPPAHEAGFTIGATRDAVTVHRILDEAFDGSWGYETTSFDDWLAVRRSFAGYDPDLWVLAEIDGAAVAAMIMSRRSVDEGSLYVQELATTASHRRRGIASSLLRHAFDVAATEGYAQVNLHVDSSSPDDAPAVYRRAGFDVRCAYDAFSLSLVP